MSLSSTGIGAYNGFTLRAWDVSQNNPMLNIKAMDSGCLGLNSMVIPVGGKIGFIVTHQKQSPLPPAIIATSHDRLNRFYHGKTTPM